MNLEVALGILFAFITAVMHAGAYALSRRFVVVRQASAARLLVLSHTFMGAACAVAIALLWNDTAPPLDAFVRPLLGASGFYMVGQFFLYMALLRTDSSRVAPLMGMKIVFVAIIATVALGAKLDILQWAAVFIAVAAVFMMNRAGAPLPPATLTSVLLSCLSYSICDINIRKLIEALSPMGDAMAPVMAALTTYSLAGAVAMMCLPWFGTRRGRDWTSASIYGAILLAANLFLFAAFATAGVVLANIVVSTRGLTAIALGVIIARLGHHHIEQHVDRPTLIRRILAAAMMLTAIILYVV